jgi:hypothetical protein
MTKYNGQRKKDKGKRTKEKVIHEPGTNNYEKKAKVYCNDPAPLSL